MRAGCMDTSGATRVGVYSLRQGYDSFIVESSALQWSGYGLDTAPMGNPLEPGQ